MAQSVSARCTTHMRMCDHECASIARLLQQTPLNWQASAQEDLSKMQEELKAARDAEERLLQFVLWYEVARSMNRQYLAVVAF